MRDLAVEGDVPSSELTTGTVRTFGGSTLEVVVEGSTITFGGAPVVDADITAVNGVAHAIDTLPVASGTPAPD